MMIYYVTLCVLLAGGWLTCVYRPSKQNLVLYLACAGVVLVAIATLRYSIGYDYFNYERIYYNISGMSFSQILKDPVYIEFIGYAVLNKLLAFEGAMGYMTLLLVINIALTALVFWMIYKHSSMPWISVYVYITLQFFAHSMNLVRQSIAATICLLAYRFIRDKKLIPFLLVIAVAFLFHTSALFMLPVYFVLNWNASIKHYLIVGIPALLIYVYSTPIATLVTKYIFTNYAGYINSRYWAGLKWTYAVFPLIYFAITLYYRKALLKEDPKNKVLVNSAFYTFLLYFFSTHHMILERFSIYIFFYSLFLIPAILGLHKVDYLPKPDSKYIQNFSREERQQAREKMFMQERTKQLAIVISLVLCLGYFQFASVQGTNGYHKVYPYVGIWQQTDDPANEV